MALKYNGDFFPLASGMAFNFFSKYFTKAFFNNEEKITKV